MIQLPPAVPDQLPCASGALSAAEDPWPGWVSPSPPGAGRASLQPGPAASSMLSHPRATRLHSGRRAHPALPGNRGTAPTVPAPFPSVPTPSPRRGQGRRFKSFKRNKYMNALSICRAQSFYRLRKGRAFKVLPLKTPWTALLETSLASNENMLCLIPNIPGLAYHLHLSR